MKLRVLFFSLLRDIVGQAEISVELPEGQGDTVGDLLGHLYVTYPKLRDWDKSLLIAVDLEYVKRGAPLSDGQEVAIMPPVQGG